MYKSSQKKERIVMTKAELIAMIALKTSEYISAVGVIKKAKRPCWAKGAKERKTMHVANKKTTYSIPFTGPVGLKTTNFQKMGDSASGYNTKYVFS